MNFISWNTKPSIINEQTQNYLSDVRLDEATEIGKLVAPMANKMKNIKVNGQKVKVGEPYRDTRLFFLNYLKDEYPELVPDGFKAYSAAHVHKLIGEIAMNSPEKLKDIFDNFKDWSETKVLAGDGKEVDRMTQYINTKATLRQGKGVRQTRDAEAATGGTKRDFKKLKVDDISSASKEKEKEEQLKASKEKIDNVEGMMSNDAAGEAISIIPNLMNVLTSFHGEIEEMDLDSDGFKSQLQILKNVTDVAPSLRTLSKYKEFVNYLGQLDEYGEIRQHLADQIPNIEADIARYAETEDNEHEQKKPDFLDVNGNGNKTESMEKALADVVKQKALQRAIEKEEEEVQDYTVTTERGDSSFPKNRQGLTAAYKFIQGKNNWIIKYGDEVVDQSKDVDNKHEQEESLVGKEAVLDYTRPVMVVDHGKDGFVSVQDEQGRPLRVSVNRLTFPEAVEEVSLEDATTLSHGEYEAVKNFQSFDPSEWQEKEDRSGWERKRKGGEDEEAEESNIKFSVGSVGGQHGQIMHIDKTFDSLEDACNHAGVDVQDCISGEWDDMGDGTKEYGVDEDTVIIMHVDKAEYERARGEDKEFTTNQYMPKVPAYEQRKEEAEEVRMSQLEINQHLAVQERQRVQNLYAQQRRHTHGY